MPATRRLFTVLLVAATLLGIGVGWMCSRYLPPDQAAQIAANLSLITDAFLRLIKMIIAPLVFSTLVAAIARMGSGAEIGRVGIKAMAWFIAASCVSLTIGLLMAHWLQPGAALHLAQPAAGTGTDGIAKFSLGDFVAHLIPRSIAEAMANNEILQI